MSIPSDVVVGMVVIGSFILCLVAFVGWDEVRMKAIAKSLTAAGFAVDRPKFLQRKSDDPVTRSIQIGARMRWHTSGVMNGLSFSLAESQVYGRRNVPPHTVIHITAPVALVSLRYSRNLVVRLLSRTDGLAPGWKLIDGDMTAAVSTTTAIEALRHSLTLGIDEISIDEGGILIACHRRLNSAKVAALMTFGDEVTTIVARAAF